MGAFSMITNLRMEVFEALLKVVELTELSLSLHTLSLLLLHLPRLTSLDHNHLHEALWLMDKTGMDSG